MPSTPTTPPHRQPTHAPSAEHNVGAWPALHARSQGARDAVIDARRRLDWAEFDRRVARSAGWLADQGVDAGERVAMLLGNRSVTLELVFAAARIGAIVVPINLRLSPREIAFQLDDCTPQAFFFESELAQIAERACARARQAPRLRMAVGPNDEDQDVWEGALAAAPEHHEVQPVTPDDAMMIMYTSGTTGEPKGALLPHRKALFNALNAGFTFGLTPEDRVLIAAPLFHSLGLQILALPALHAGAAVVLHDHFDAERVWRDVDRERISFLGGVPAMHQRLYEELVASSAAQRAARGLRFVFSAGAAISVDLIRSFSEHGVVIKQGYGQTETSTLTCLDDADALRKAGSVGRPVRFGDVRVVKLQDLEEEATRPERWRDTEDGERGEIVVRGDITMLGYWGRPEDTAATLVDGWLRTGDLASRDGEGFITLVGRARDMIISGGENVYPAEVEAVFREHPTIQEIAVVGIPDARWGEVGRAHVIVQDGCTLDPPALTHWARDRLAKFKIPQHWVVAEELPRTASGKVRKHLLQDTTR